MADVEEQRQIVKNEASDSDLTRKELNIAISDKLSSIIDILTDTRQYASEVADSIGGFITGYTH